MIEESIGINHDIMVDVGCGDMIYFDVSAKDPTSAAVFWTPQVEYIQTAKFTANDKQILNISEINNGNRIECLFYDAGILEKKSNAYLAFYDKNGTMVKLSEAAFVGGNSKGSGCILSFDIDFSNIWGELNKLLGKLKSGEIGNSIKSLFNNLGTTLKPFFDGIDEMFGFNLDKWLKDLGNFIGDIVTDISNGDIDKAIDDVFAFVKNSFINIAPSITTICSKIIGEVDKLLGTSFQKSFDKCAELCYQAGVMLNNVINDTVGKTERSQKYNTTYSEMLTYMRDWMVKNDSTSADKAYGETVSHFNINNDEELKKWFDEGNYGASLYEFAKTTAMRIKNDEVDPVLKRRLKGQSTWADISSLGILGYADGGFPDYGDLFIANEAGPELVGTIGNRTAVANSSTIETAIYNAVRSAMSDSNTGGQPADIHVTVDIDGDTVGETVARYNAVRNRRLNGRS